MPSINVVPYGLAAMLVLLPGLSQLPVAPLAPPVAKQTVKKEHLVQRAKDGFFYVDADVDGVPVRFLVDTGASVAVLSNNDARRIGLMMRSKSMRVRTVGGDVEMASATLDRLAIGDRTLLSVDAVVAPSAIRHSLIGQNVLSQFASVSMRGDTMRFD